MTATVTENRRARRAACVRIIVAGVVLVSALAGTRAVSAAPAGAVEPEPLTAIAAAAQAYVRSQLPAAARIESVRADALDPRLHLPRCAEALHASLPPGATLQARTTVGVQCPGPSAWSVYVPVTTEMRVTVLVLARPVSHDARLSAEDVAVETRKVSGAGAAFLNDVRDLQGRTVRRPLPAGTALTADMFKPDVLVHRGQTVTLIAAAGAIEVRASGLALTDGEAGARLRVQNLSSQKIVEGVVESSDTVRVGQ